MKLTTKLLKTLIYEAKAEQKRKKGIFKSDLSTYELEDIDTDQQMINMLGEILNQLKTLVYYSTPAKSPIAATGEKQWAATIQEVDIGFSKEDIKKIIQEELEGLLDEASA